jgi:diacylglycerol diphosphate phosphatase/phosphatidate phosphatase
MKMIKLHPIGTIRPYMADLAVGILLVAAGGMLDLFAPPVQRKFFLDDRSIMYPHSRETVSNVLLVVRLAADPQFIAWIGPGVLLLLFVLLRTRHCRAAFIAVLGKKRRLLAGLLMAAGLTIMLTNFAKVMGGRLRPDFLDRCQFDASAGSCTGRESLVREGRLSFPSGHSSSRRPSNSRLLRGARIPGTRAVQPPAGV